MSLNIQTLIQKLDDPNINPNNVFVKYGTSEIVAFPSYEGLLLLENKDELIARFLQVMENRSKYYKVPRMPGRTAHMKLNDRKVFASLQTRELREKLYDAMDIKHLISNFSELVDNDPALHNAWREFDINQKTEALESWARFMRLIPRPVRTS